DQPGLQDLVPLGPEFEAAHDDRVVRQVERRARAERHDHLALPDLAVRSLGFRTGPAHTSTSGSIATSSIVRSQRFTPDPASRIERFARNFLWRGCIVLSSGSRNSWSRGFAAPASVGLYWSAVPWLW